MTFEPDYVTVHPGPDYPSIAIETEAYEGIFRRRVGGRSLTSVMGLTSISAAAVAPSLGRMSMGSTNALIAALNLRLGVWMPNPMYLRGRRARVHMYSMFKEMLGMFDLTDPNLYVTDGGHWENLALVELIRRKAEIIIAVDASADPPHTFNSLKEAMELAIVECDARVEFRPGEMLAMQPNKSIRPPKNWAIADINYSDGSCGRLLYVKAQAANAMPARTLRYSKEDPEFPNYSTANQFLTEPEFSNLARLGRDSMIKALEDEMKWLFNTVEDQAGAGEADGRPADSDAEIQGESGPGGSDPESDSGTETATSQGRPTEAPVAASVEEPASAALEVASAGAVATAVDNVVADESATRSDAIIDDQVAEADSGIKVQAPPSTEGRQTAPDLEIATHYAIADAPGAD